MIGISKVPKLIRKENYIKAQRPKEDYLYFWFLGVKRQGRGQGAVREIKDAVFEMAHSPKKPRSLLNEAVDSFTWVSGSHPPLLSSLFDHFYYSVGFVIPDQAK